MVRLWQVQVSTMNGRSRVQIRCSSFTRRTSGWMAELETRVPSLWLESHLNPPSFPNSGPGQIQGQIRAPSCTVSAHTAQ